MPMSTVMSTVSKTPIPAHVRSVVFEICCDDAEGNDIEVPFVEYHLPNHE
jgi:ubiquitin-activating enzyme E1